MRNKQQISNELDNFPLIRKYVLGLESKFQKRQIKYAKKQHQLLQKKINLLSNLYQEIKSQIQRNCQQIDKMIINSSIQISIQTINRPYNQIAKKIQNIQKIADYYLDQIFQSRRLIVSSPQIFKQISNREGIAKKVQFMTLQKSYLLSNLMKLIQKYKNLQNLSIQLSKFQQQYKIISQLESQSIRSLTLEYDYNNKRLKSQSDRFVLCPPKKLSSLKNMILRSGSVNQSRIDISSFGDVQYPKLQTFKIEALDLIKLPKFNAFCIKQVIVGANHIQCIEGFCNEYYPNLELLDLSCNEIQRIPRLQTGIVRQKANNQLQIISGITTIKLNHNKIHDIQSFALSYLPKLKVLLLQTNNLSYMPKLYNCENLEQLNLFINPLQSIDEFLQGTYKMLSQDKFQYNLVRSVDGRQDQMNQMPRMIRNQDQPKTDQQIASTIYSNLNSNLNISNVSTSNLSKRSRYSQFSTIDMNQSMRQQNPQKSDSFIVQQVY